MGTMRPCHTLGALLLSVFICICNALPSVPIATDPILATETISTVLPSLVTIYSVVPATDAPDALETITTTINGRETVLTTANVIAGSSTTTIISTLSLTTSQLVVNTIGFSTVFGPDPTEPATDVAASPPATTPTPAPTQPVPEPSASEASTLEIESSLPASVSEAGATVSTTSASTATSTAVSANTSSSSASTSKGLSTGAKAGIGVGVAIAVILLVILSFFLGQRFSNRRKQSSAAQVDDSSTVEEKDVFQAGRPYEMTGSRHYPSGLSTGKGQAYSRTTTEVGSGSESVSGKSYDVRGSTSPSNLNDSPELSALPPMRNEDEPMYVGVPSHMSGSKRWSMKEYSR